MNNFHRILLSVFAASIALPVGAQEASVVITSNASPDHLSMTLRSEYETVRTSALQELTEPVFKETPRLAINERCPLLFNMIKNLADSMHIAMPEVFIFKGNGIEDTDWQRRNASAGKKAMDDAGIVTIGEELLMHPDFALTYAELQAVLAHEVAHLKHAHGPQKRSYGMKLAIGDGLSAIAILGAIIYLQIKKNLKVEDARIMAEAGITVSSILWALPFLKFSRHCEKEADLTAMGFTHYTNLVSALKKIESMWALKGPATSTIFSTHPSTAEREKYMQEFEQKHSPAPSTIADQSTVEQPLAQAQA